jgi:hypothetical protein
MHRNVAIAIGNAIANGRGGARYVARLREWASSTDEGLRTAAEWALRQFDDRGNTAEDH